MIQVRSIRKEMLAILMIMAGAFAALAVTPQEAVDEFTRRNGISPRSVAVKITDLKSGSTLGTHNSGAPLIPASIMKSVTSAALLGEAGPDFRYHTGVYVDGPLDMGILRGNLVVKGSGDPSLGSVAEPCGTDFIAEITDVMKSMGVHKIEGDIIIDESAFGGSPRPASWQPADFSQSYGTGFHAFNFENNATGRKSVENPKAGFKSRLKSRLRSSGISIDSKDIAGGKQTLVFDHVSPPLDEIMRSCMMRSDNLFAESMLRNYGKLTGGDGSTDDAARRETALWRKSGLPLNGVTIIDGSGLSRDNRVTADFMTAVLTARSDNPVYASLFPLAGQEGTLKSFLKETPLDGYIAMKTGSMRGIQCYAGYLLDEDYAPTHTVVIIMNEITGSRDKAKKVAEKMLLDIFTNHVSSTPADEKPDFEVPADSTSVTDDDLREVIEVVEESLR